MTLALPSLVAPTRLRVPDLLHATDAAADHVLSGRYDHLQPAGGPPADERWFTRLHGDDELDVWLISWVPERSTELHDHGGSLGALTVVSGALTESRWDGTTLRQRRLSAGDQAGFPLGWVHDVVWAPEAPAVPDRTQRRSASRRAEAEAHPETGADAQRARLLAAADRDVLLRGHRAQYASS